MSRSTDDARTGTSRFVVPAGAWDSHVHIFDHPPAITIKGGRKVPFPHAPAEALDAMLGRLGLDHAVIVDGALGGTDILIGQLRESGGRHRGVAIVDDGVTDDDLKRLDEAGVRGCRFYFVDFLGHPQDPDAYRRSIDRIARLGWHALLFLEPKDLIAHERLIRDTPVPIVLDHLCQVEHAGGIDQPAMELILDLQTSRDTYVKISSGDRRSVSGPPDYADDLPFGRRVVERDATRVLWATDWPHVIYKTVDSPFDPPPDDLDLLHLLFGFCRSQAEVDLILRDNPARLYA